LAAQARRGEVSLFWRSFGLITPRQNPRAVAQHDQSAFVIFDRDSIKRASEFKVVVAR
jgi:hypothetical protein